MPLFGACVDLYPHQIDAVAVALIPLFGSQLELSCNTGASLSKHRFLGYETRNQPVLPRKQFVKRLGWSVLIASVLIGVSLLAGMAGYHFLEDLPWIDSFANAAMILSGMGPLAPIQTFGGKLFAGLYALYSGLVVIVAAGILLAPVLHRMLHQFHVESDEKD